MQRTKFMIGILICFFLSTFLRAATAPDAIKVSGVVSKPGDWTIARLKTELAADVTTISYTSHGQKHTATAVPLLSLLKAAGVQTDMKMDPNADPKAKNYQLRLVVVIQARDGYSVTFSLAELLASAGNHPAWLALDMDGQPLPERDGSMRLIVPDDQTPARSIHAIETITIVDPRPATTRPAN